MTAASLKRSKLRKIWIIVLSSMIVTACLYGLLFFYVHQQHYRLLTQMRQDALQRVVLTARGGLDSILEDLRTGSIDRREALQEVRDKLVSMRPQTSPRDSYVFLVGFDAVPLIDPVFPSREGQALWEWQAPDGRYPIRELAELARSNTRGGFLEYLLQRPGTEGPPKRKVAFVLGVPELGAFLCAGEYLDDMEAFVRGDSLRTGAMVVVLYLLGLIFPGLALREAYKHNVALEQEAEERTAAEQGLRHAEERYRLIASRPGQLVMDQDLDKGRVYWAGDARGISGFDMLDYETGGMDFFLERLHPEERETIRRGVATSRESGSSWNTVCRFQRKDGIYIYVEINLAYMRDGSGRPVRMVGSMRNVDALVRADDEVRRSEAKYRTLARNFPSGVVLLFDSDLRFVLADGAGLRSVGFTGDEMIGRTPSQVFPPSVARNAERHFRSALAGEDNVFEMTYAGRIFMVHALPVRSSDQLRGGGAEGMAVIRDVTASKLAEKALTESERRLSTLISNLPGMVYRSRFHEKWILEFVSPGCRDLTGLPQEELLFNRGTNWEQLVHPDDRAHVFGEVQEGLREGRPFVCTYRIRTRQGELKWVWERGIGVSTTTNEPVVEGIILDITSRKLAEEGLARSLSYEAVLNRCAKELLSMAGEDDVLPRILEELRLASDTCRVYIFENYEHPEDGLCCRQTHEVCRAGVESQMDNAHLQHIPYDSIIPRWRGELSQGHLLVGVVEDMPAEERHILEEQDIKSLLVLPIRGGGNWTGFIGFDDTRRKREWDDADRMFLRTAADMVGVFLERHRAENRLREAHGELDQIFNSTADGMALIGLDGTVLRVNRAMGEMFNIDFANAHGKPCEEIIKDDRCDLPICPLCRLRQGQDRTDHTFTMTVADGTLRHYRSATTPFRDVRGEVVGIVASTRDITARVRAEAEAKERERQLIQADKLAALGTLVSGVAHEINNPNGIITLNAPTLHEIWRGALPVLEEHYRKQGDFSLGEVNYSLVRTEADGLFEQVVESARRIKRIVAELKGFARQDGSGRDEIVDVNDVTRAAVGLVSNKIKKCTHRFETRWSETPIQVLGNYQRLEQVLVNALINACEALTDPNQGVFVEIGLEPDGDHCHILVRDEGRGMNPDEISHAFEPFFTTKRDSGGTGLGLSVSHGIIQEHGGRMTFTSELGKGTVCAILLPLHWPGEKR
ncbi:MAG: PAS domain S-box protein [Desulfovibrionaceae bacterium]